MTSGHYRRTVGHGRGQSWETPLAIGALEAVDHWDHWDSLLLQNGMDVEAVKKACMKIARFHTEIT